MSALQADFGGDDLAHAFDQLRVPCRSLSRRRGECRGPDGHVAVGGFLSEEEGNAQPRVLHGVALHSVGQPRRQLRGQPRPQVFLRPRIGAERTPQHADMAVLHRFAESVGQTDRVAVPFVHLPAVRRRQLSDLLVERHLGRQQFGPFLRRKACVAPVGAACRGGRARRQQ